MGRWRATGNSHPLAKMWAIGEVGGTEGELCGVLRAADVNVNIQRSSAP